MSDIVAIHKFAVDGDHAKKLYEIFQKSYFIETGCAMQPYEGCSVQVDFSFTDGVFHVEERTTGEMSYIAEILYFFEDGDHIHAMSEYLDDRAPQRQIQREEDLPF